MYDVLSILYIIKYQLAVVHYFYLDSINMQVEQVYHIYFNVYLCMYTIYGMVDFVRFIQ